MVGGSRDAILERAQKYLRRALTRLAAPQSVGSGANTRRVVLLNGEEANSPGLSERCAARVATGLMLSGLFALLSTVVYLYLFGNGHHGGGGTGRVSAEERRQVLTLWLALPVTSLSLWNLWGAIQIAAGQQTRSRHRRSLAVVAHADGSVPTLEAALIRSFSPLMAALAGYCAALAVPLSAAVLFALAVATGTYAAFCFSAVWDPDRRGWPDKLAGTVVVQQRVASRRALRR